MIQSLDRLKVFYQVFSKKSVIAAAKTLHISQPAVSQSLQKLESEINIPLFTRLHKRLIPTAAGERLFAVVRPFMAELDICLKTLENAKEQPFGELRIGAPAEFGKTNLPAIVAAFIDQYPDVTFYLKFGDPGILLPMVDKGQIDFALVDVFKTRNQFIGSLDNYHFAPFVEEEIILVCSKQYYEKSLRKDHSFKCLIQQKFIAYRRNAQTIRDWFKHHFGKPNVDFHIILTVDSHRAVISAIKHHVGMGMVASHMVSDEIQSDQLVCIYTSKPEIINPVSLVHLKNKIPTFSEKVFEKFLAKKIKSIGI